MLLSLTVACLLWCHHILTKWAVIFADWTSGGILQSTWETLRVQSTWWNTRIMAKVIASLEHRRSRQQEICSSM